MDANGICGEEMTKEISLTKGYVTIVDDDWYEMLSQVKWSAIVSHDKVYATRDKTPNKVKMHRLIMDVGNKDFVDHINGDGLDNRCLNLRICSPGENRMNSIKKCKSSSKYKGVIWKNKSKVYEAWVSAYKKKIYIGSFKNEEDAALAYNYAAQEYQGEFSRLNIVKGGS